VPQHVTPPQHEVDARHTGCDRRAADALRELVDAEWQHARALARARMAVPGSDEYAQAVEHARELARSIVQLERAISERPWTEL